MHFLPDVYVKCDACTGQRFNRDTLDMRYKGKHIAAVLDLTVDDAVEFFANVPTLRQKFLTLQEVGLGYIRLGQAATTLSGGEAQRVKLSRELSRRSTGRTLYILDEPTTGLHLADIQHLLEVLARLVQGGNTVLVIEHHLEVIKTADYVIDLGPEGGDGGGHIVATGTPERVAQVEESYTGHFLREVLHASAALSHASP
jgi:excinuclease ABC subunit A